jgi:hypothetical protein
MDIKRPYVKMTILYEEKSRKGGAYVWKILSNLRTLFNRVFQVCLVSLKDKGH